MAECNASTQPLMITEDVQPFLKTALSANQYNYQISYIISAPFPLSESRFPWFATAKVRKRYKALSL